VQWALRGLSIGAPEGRERFLGAAGVEVMTAAAGESGTFPRVRRGTAAETSLEPFAPALTDLKAFDKAVENVLEAAQHRNRLAAQLGVRENLTKLVTASAANTRRHCEESHQRELGMQRDLQLKLLKSQTAAKAKEVELAKKEQQRRHRAALTTVEQREQAALAAAKAADGRAEAAARRLEVAAGAGNGDLKAALVAAEQREKTALQQVSQAERCAREATERADTALKAEEAAAAAATRAKEALGAARQAEADAKENVAPAIRKSSSSKEELAKIQLELDQCNRIKDDREAQWRRNAASLEADVQRKSVALQDLSDQLRDCKNTAQAELNAQRNELSKEREQVVTSARRGADCAEEKLNNAELAAAAANEAAVRAGRERDEERLARCAAETTAADLQKQVKNVGERCLRMQRLFEQEKALSPTGRLLLEREKATSSDLFTWAPQLAAPAQQQTQLQQQQQQPQQQHRVQIADEHSSSSSSSSGSNSPQRQFFVEPTEDLVAMLAHTRPDQPMQQARSLSRDCQQRGRPRSNSKEEPRGILRASSREAPPRGKRRYSPGPQGESTADLCDLLSAAASKAPRVSAPATMSARILGGAGPMGAIANAVVHASASISPRSPIVMLPDNKARGAMGKVATSSMSTQSQWSARSAASSREPSSRPWRQPSGYASAASSRQPSADPNHGRRAPSSDPVRGMASMRAASTEASAKLGSSRPWQKPTTCAAVRSESSSAAVRSESALRRQQQRTPGSLLIMRHAELLDKEKHFAVIRDEEWADKEQRPYDPPISSSDMPSEAARKLQKYGIRQIWTSPFRACIQTAAVVARELGIDHLRVHNGLGESLQEVKKSFKNYHLQDQPLSYVTTLEAKSIAGEGVKLSWDPHSSVVREPDDLKQRAARVIQAITNSVVGEESVLIVTHSSLLNAYMPSLDNDHSSLKTEPAGYIAIRGPHGQQASAEAILETHRTESIKDLSSRFRFKNPVVSVSMQTGPAAELQARAAAATARSSSATPKPNAAVARSRDPSVDVKSRIQEAYSRGYAKAPAPADPAATKKMMRSRKEVGITSASSEVDNASDVADADSARATGESRGGLGRLMFWRR